MSLSELQGADPLILTLARGHYCPKAREQHLELAALYPKIAVAHTDCHDLHRRPPHSPGVPRVGGPQWTFLSDPERTVQKDLDIAEYTDPEHNPMIPHTLVLKPGLIIHSIYNGYWFCGRPSIVDLWHDLRAATSEIRPDWDLGTPGLREAWNAGDLPAFHGWNKDPKRFSLAAEKSCGSHTMRKAPAPPLLWGDSGFKCLKYPSRESRFGLIYNLRTTYFAVFRGLAHLLAALPGSCRRLGSAPDRIA